MKDRDLVDKSVILGKLQELQEKVPDFSVPGSLAPQSLQRRWLSTAGALLQKHDLASGFAFRSSMSFLESYPTYTVNRIQGYVLDAIEAIKLELELDGRSEIGTAYASGEVYKFYADLKRIIHKAEKEILMIDRYLDSSAFEAYFSENCENVQVRILTEQYAGDVKTYIDKHRTEFSSNIELRTSDELHDRVIFIDYNVCWVCGSSLKDGGKKVTYLTPLHNSLVESKRRFYLEIWDRSTPM